MNLKTSVIERTKAKMSQSLNEELASTQHDDRQARDVLTELVTEEDLLNGIEGVSWRQFKVMLTPVPTRRNRHDAHELVLAALSDPSDTFSIPEIVAATGLSRAVVATQLRKLQERLEEKLEGRTRRFRLMEREEEV